MSTEPLQWLVSQIGSRELYACAVSFQRRKRLKRFYTDVWWPYAPSAFARMPTPLWGLSLRHHAELPADKVTSFTGWAILDDLRWKLRSGSRDVGATFRHYLETGRHFGTKVAEHMAGLALDPRRDALFAFSTGALEPLRHARDRGLFTVVDQLDPARVDQEMVLEEMARWPDWEPPHDRIPEEYFARLGEEWKAADLVVVNSNFSRDALVRQGVAREKVLVVPLCYERESTVAPKKTSSNAPLRVLWLGQVVLRKGIPYLFEAASLLRNERIEFQVAGRIGISDKAVATAPPNVQMLGKVNRERALELYSQADVFVLPTISEGFAITQIEAMSFGLPVVTTPNCGDVVTSGKDGLIVPIRDPRTLADALLELHADRKHLRVMSDNALLKWRQFTLDHYAETIEAAALRLRGRRAAA